MKVRFLFYKAAIDGKILDNAISSWTGLFPCNWGTKGYSHVEFEAEGRCFSSTTRGGARGVRFAPSKEVLKHPERWDYVEYDAPEERLRRTLRHMSKLVGLKYDYNGILGFFLPWNTESKDKWYCSEICALVAYELKLIPYHKRISPRRLSKIMGGAKPLQ
ncbi:MAG: hypothetical protein KAS32_10850 [Candidatus Peribacteraceae bacterium]|nr:hypothetical protein [Candidatus Peribacteraceae bacterium]